MLALLMSSSLSCTAVFPPSLRLPTMAKAAVRLLVLPCQLLRCLLDSRMLVRLSVSYPYLGNIYLTMRFLEAVLEIIAMSGLQ